MSSRLRKKCIIHCFTGNSKDKVMRVSEYAYGVIQKEAEERRKDKSTSGKILNIFDGIPKSFLELNHDSQGMHRSCYKKFTANMKRNRSKRSSPEDITNSPLVTPSKSPRLSEDVAGSSVGRRSGKLDSVMLFTRQCIFCNRLRKWDGKNRTTEATMPCATKTAQLEIISAAERKGDLILLIRIRGVDFVAKCIHYHNSCRRNYTRKGTHDKRLDRDPNEVEKYNAFYSAHEQSFSDTCNYIDREVLGYGRVIQLRTLYDRYQEFLLINHPQHYNKNYKMYKLKNKIVERYGADITFWQPNQKTGDLIYTKDILSKSSSAKAFELSSSDEKVIYHCASIVRKSILEKYNDISPSWPPNLDRLEKEENQPPALLTSLLAKIVSGAPLSKVSGRKENVIHSIAQDICYSTTNGEWSTAKHTALGICIHHLTGSAKIISLLNKLGHCCSYSYVLECETGFCDLVIKTTGDLPPGIQRIDGATVHFCFDNWDLTEETLTGLGTTHSTHGIVIQEQISIPIPAAPLSLPRSRSRSIQFMPPDNPEYHGKDKVEPVLAVNITEPHKLQAVKTATRSDTVWSLTRLCNQEQQVTPGWSAWVSLTASFFLSLLDMICCYIILTCA